MGGRRIGDAPIRPIGRNEVINGVLARLNSGAVVGLVGEPGIGKTTVWRTCVDQSNARWIWEASCSEAEQNIGLAVLADFFAAVPTVIIDQLPPPQRRAVDVALLRVDAGSDGIDARLLGVTTTSMLEALAQRGSLLLAVDDMQWCDQTSLAALRFALRRTELPSVAFLSARRISEIEALPREETLALGPLDPDETTRLIRATGRTLQTRALQRVVAVSEGNPFYALELARAVPPDTNVVRVPPSLNALLERRFDGLPTRCRAALLDIAVRGTLRDQVALSPAHERGILVADGPSARFSHPLLAEATCEQATHAQLRAAHKRAAEASRDPVVSARHHALAAAEPDEGVAASLDKAVKFAQLRGDVVGARDLAELALTMTPHGERPIHRVAMLASCEGALSNDRAAHQLAVELVERATDPHDRFVGLMILTRTSPSSEAIGYADTAAKLGGLPTESRLEARGELALLLFLSGRGQDAERVLVDALAQTARNSPVWAGLTAYLAIAQRQLGRPYDEENLLRAVELDRQGLAKPGGLALEVAAYIATYDDRHTEARRLFEEATAISFATSDRGDALDVQLARLELRRGNLKEAREAAELMAESRADDRRRRDLATLARICAWQGDFESARQAIEDAQASEPVVADPRTRIGIDCAAGLLALLDGDPERAWPTLARAAATLEAIGIREPSIPGALPLAIEAAAGVGEVDQAELLCSRLAEQAAVVHSRWGEAGVLWSRGHIALARGYRAAAVDLFDQAASAYEAIALPLEQARALLAAGSTLRRSGLRNAAHERLLASRALFTTAGAEGLARSADEELARLGQPQQVPDDLTEAERQVARLAARGLRNTEIGQRLRISPKTVEHHLGKVYRKLNVRGRADLGTALGENEPTAVRR
jgi:DNA-binding CsgD family transcriptional regulator